MYRPIRPVSRWTRPSISTGRSRTCSFLCLRRARLGCPSVRLSVCYWTCEHDNLKANESTLMPVSTSGSRGKWCIWSINFRVRLSKIIVRHTRSKIDLKTGRIYRHHCRPVWSSTLYLYTNIAESKFECLYIVSLKLFQDRPSIDVNIIVKVERVSGLHVYVL